MLKKILALSIIVAACYSCGNNAGSTTAATSDSTKKEDITQNPAYKKGLAVIANSNCLTCHKVEETSTGPAYRDVANKYPDNEATIDTLANKIINGGSGNWGAVAMTPHPELSQDDAKACVKYILLLKNK